MATQYITLADGTRIPVQNTGDYDSGTNYDYEGALNSAGYLTLAPNEDMSWLNEHYGLNMTPEQYREWIYGPGGTYTTSSYGNLYKPPNGIANTVNTPLEYYDNSFDFGDAVLMGITSLAGAGLTGMLPGTTNVFSGLGSALGGGENVLNGMDLSGGFTNFDAFNPTTLTAAEEGAAGAFSPMTTAGGGYFPYGEAGAQMIDGSAQTMYDALGNAGVTGYDSALTSGAAAGGAAGSSVATMGGSLMDTLSKLPGSAIDWITKNPAAAAQIFGTTVQGISSFLASRAQTASADKANDTIWNMYQQNRADQAPYRQAGVGALNRLVDLTTPGKQFDTALLDPGYQFRLSEGEKGINRMAAGRGSFDSGATLKALNRYNQDYATGEYGNVFNRNALLAGVGQTATNATGNYGANAANSISGNQIGAGNARASGYVGVGNAINSGINNYQQNELVNRLLTGMRY